MIIIIVITTLLLAALFYFLWRREQKQTTQHGLHATFDARVRQQILDNKFFPVKEVAGLQYLYHIEYNEANYERMKVMIAENEVGKLNEDDFSRQHTMDEILLVMATTGENKAYLVMLFDGAEFKNGPVLAHMYEAPMG